MYDWCMTIWFERVLTTDKIFGFLAGGLDQRPQHLRWLNLGLDSCTCITSLVETKPNQGKKSIVPLGRALGLLESLKEMRGWLTLKLCKSSSTLCCVCKLLCVWDSPSIIISSTSFLLQVSLFQRERGEREESGHQFPSPSRLTQLMMLVIGGRKRRQWNAVKLGRGEKEAGDRETFLCSLRVVV